MASTSPISNPAIIPAQSPAAQTTGTRTPRATAVNDPANDTTTYVTNADGTINVTTTNAQGEIIEISTIPAAVVATAGSGFSASHLAPGSLLSRVA